MAKANINGTALEGLYMQELVHTKTSYLACRYGVRRFCTEFLQFSTEAIALGFASLGHPFGNRGHRVLLGV